MSLMREETADEYKIKDLQNKILETMMWVDGVCRENGIDYCLMGGSAIGAIRHKGFVPWDDDLDIFMTAESYAKFRSLFKDNKLGGFYLQEWCRKGEMVTMAKVRMDGTAYIEELLEPLNIHHGIYIDIMILHKCPSNKVSQFFQYLCGRYVVAKGLADRGYNRRKGAGSILLGILRLFPRGFAVKCAMKRVYKYDKKTTRFYCNFMGKSNFKKSIYPVEWIDKTVYAPFEKVELRIPAQAENYLSKRFGDYMKIPSSERIAWEQHAKNFSLDKDFREVLGRYYEDFSDEKILI